jgi:DNA mismatch repair protein MutS2
MDIVSKSLKALEWEKLKTYLAQEACSDWSTQLCLHIPINCELKIVEILLAETQEAFSLISEGFELSQIGLPELRPIIERLKTGASLSANEFHLICHTLLLGSKTKTLLSDLENNEFQHLIKYAKQISQLSDLVKSINNVIDKDASIKDNASTYLLDLKQKAKRTNAKIKDQLNKIINSSTLSKALQEPLYTQRNGRYVLPVNSSMTNVIEGLVHDSSASGLTVYIEPYAVVESSNKARLIESQIEAEIVRILTELTEETKKYTEAIENTYKILVDIDFIAARARLAKKYNGICPKITLSTKTHLKQAKHPLLILQQLYKENLIVGNDISLDDNYRTLVITGPNTGGKTVLIKTIGLMILMAQAGLLIPVDKGSVLKIYKNIYADIGDEQSLEQSLSTFSAHITNIVDIVNNADAYTLVLLDEIGAGTDPKEGMALAKSILEYLNQIQAHTIATTHFGELKTLAHSDNGFVNASFEFDEQTLSPTYKLHLGLAGKSRAFEIAKRIGLKDNLIAKAIEFYSLETDDTQKTADLLQEQLSQAKEKEIILEEKIKEVTDKELQAERLLNEIDTEKENIRIAYAQKIESQFQLASQEIKEMIAQLQKSPDMKKAQESQKKVDGIFKDLGWHEQSNSMKTEDFENLHVGQNVKVLSLNQIAIIEDLPAKKDISKQNMALVRTGNIKIKVPISDLRSISQNKPNKLKSHKNIKSGTIKETSLNVFVRSSINTVDLRGQTVDDALINVEQFIDAKYYEKTSPIMIIHGHGTGAVRAAVRSYLSNSGYELKFREGESYEGGNGVTIVELGF